MKTIIALFVLFILFSAFAYAGGNNKCTIPTNGMNITVNTRFCSGTYNFPSGIKVIRDRVVLDCNYANIRGSGTGTGIFTNNSNAIIKNCNINNYVNGIKSIGNNNIIQNNLVYNTAFGIGIAPFDLVFKNKLNNNKVGIDVSRTNNFRLIENNINNSEVNGILLYYANNGIIYRNAISNSGWNRSYVGGGITVNYVNYNNSISQNKLTYNQRDSFWLRGRPGELPVRNRIWDNYIHHTSISDANVSANIYYVGGIGNHYYDGATGP